MATPRPSCHGGLSRVPDEAADALRDHHKRQVARRLRTGEDWQDNDLVFCTRTGTPLAAGNVRRSFRAITKAAGIGEDWTPANCVTRSSRS